MAVTIVKPGRPVRVGFNCGTCGCVFTAEVADCKREAISMFSKAYVLPCPCCDERCIGDLVCEEVGA